MAAIVGAAGLAPTLAAVRRGAMVALANKECLVCAGALLMAEVRAQRRRPAAGRFRAQRDLPGASRRGHRQRRAADPDRLGRPVPRAPRAAEMASVTPREAVAHPNWSMGAKISVEFGDHDEQGARADRGASPVRPGAGPDRRSSSTRNRSCTAWSRFATARCWRSSGQPDMRIPIAYTLGWPERLAAPTPRLDLAAIGRLTFEPPDHGALPGAAPGARGAAPTAAPRRPCSTPPTRSRSPPSSPAGSASSTSPRWSRRRSRPAAGRRRARPRDRFSTVDADARRQADSAGRAHGARRRCRHSMRSHPWT